MPFWTGGKSTSGWLPRGSRRFRGLISKVCLLFEGQVAWIEGKLESNPDLVVVTVHAVAARGHGTDHVLVLPNGRYVRVDRKDRRAHLPRRMMHGAEGNNATP
ncbi:hypothetical protein GCM10022206_03590 [Streptomyces chiangmaiensis]